jgi:hypothetical protein
MAENRIQIANNKFECKQQIRMQIANSNANSEFEKPTKDSKNKKEGIAFSQSLVYFVGLVEP